MLKNRLNILWEVLGLIASVLVIVQFVPKEVFNSLPATGGDTGSHFWPVKVLHDYGIPHGVLRPWNPGNNGGEGILVHYFPFPFVLMALLGYVIPLGMAFNLGTILPVVSLPIFVWASLRVMALPFSASILGAVFSSAVVLNEGYKMWGGNGLSTMAGQFAHMYALNFLVLGVAFLWKEMEQRKFPWKSALLFSLVALSHGYIFFGVPFLILLLMAFNTTGTFRYRFVLAAISGLGSLLLSAWFVGPMILNNTWTTPHSFSWAFQDRVRELLPPIFDPILLVFVVAFVVFAWRGLSQKDRKILRLFSFWICAGLVYVGLFFVFRWLSLVDVRAVPQIQLFWVMAAGILAGCIFSALPEKIGIPVMLLTIGLVVFWEGKQVVVLPGSMKWNYTGWTVKQGYPALMELTGKIRGDFTQPRIAYEHNVQKNRVGTERVFEMLPYFANRATTESLYLQSTILAPMIYSFTSEISKAGSCPFTQWPCMRFHLKDSADHMDLLGVQQLILSSDVSLKAATEAKFLKKLFEAGDWSVFENRSQVVMAETFSKAPALIPFEGWRKTFWDWYLKYKKDSPFLITASSIDYLPREGELLTKKPCHPSTEVDFSGVTLKTDCPGVAHYLKYAYNPSFTASGGEKLFLVSPGYLGLVPQSGEVKLQYGTSKAWVFYKWVAVVAFLVFLTAAILERLGVFKKYLPEFPEKTENVPAKTAPKKHRLQFAVGIVSVCYFGMSLMTGSFLFWKWREINFNEFEVVSFQQEWGALKRNEDLDGNPIKLKGINYPVGLTTHAHSEIVLKLKKPTRFFSGLCGYPDYKSSAQISCSVRTRNGVLFTSTPLDDNNREARFRVSTGGESELILNVRSLKDNNHYAHAVWVDLKGSD